VTEDIPKTKMEIRLFHIASALAVLLFLSNAIWIVYFESQDIDEELDCKLFLPDIEEQSTWTFIDLDRYACELIENRHEQLGIYREYPDRNWYILNQSSPWTWDEIKPLGGGGSNLIESQLGACTIIEDGINYQLKELITQEECQAEFEAEKKYYQNLSNISMDFIPIASGGGGGPR